MMLTGRTRYRIGFRKKLVLQVEYWSYREWMAARSSYVREWRDATIEDMQKIDRGEVNKSPNMMPPPPPPKPANINPIPQPSPVR